MRTHDGAFCRGITPGFIITREHTQMTPSHKLLIIQSQNGIIRVQEIRMEHDLDSVAARVEELDATDLAEDRVACVVCHVVSDDGWEGVAFESKDAAFEEDFVFVGEELFGRGVYFVLSANQMYISDDKRANWVN